MRTSRALDYHTENNYANSSIFGMICTLKTEAFMTDINVDPNEIKKFSDSAAHWWNPNGEMKALHDINPLRLNYISQRTSLSQKKIIDIGCGGGILSERLAKEGAIVTGIDMSEEALHAAREHQKKTGMQIDYQKVTAEKIAEKNPEQFDVVTCLEMLEHVPDPASIVQSAAKLVRKNGDVFFSTLNRNLKSYLFAIIGAEYVLKLLPKNTHDYAKFIRPSELASLARDANLHVEEIIGLSYHPLTKKYELTKDVSVNYLMHCRKL